MTTPKIERTISIGTILTLLVLVFGGGNAWMRVQAKQEGLAHQIAALSERITGMDTEFQRGAQDRELRIRALELGAGRVDEKLLNILAGIDRIEERLEGVVP